MYFISQYKGRGNAKNVYFSVRCCCIQNTFPSKTSRGMAVFIREGSQVLNSWSVTIPLASQQCQQHPTAVRVFWFSLPTWVAALSSSRFFRQTDRQTAAGRGASCWLKGDLSYRAAMPTVKHSLGAGFLQAGVCCGVIRFW